MMWWNTVQRHPVARIQYMAMNPLTHPFHLPLLLCQKVVRTFSLGETKIIPYHILNFVIRSHISLHYSQPKVSRIPDKSQQSEKDIPRYARLGHFIGGEWFCHCGRPAVRREVKKSGCNKGLKCKFSLADIINSFDLNFSV